ncbi:hypothetical protein ACFYN9_24355 [Streptomyces collinus]|uniref:Uncharacterized protein n=2 Tax=Streptomyces TaxID=1883 RepID=A0AA89Q0A3_STRCU|nr:MULTISPECIES: hypothetical protein [Streptomyces]MBB5812092.1 hypothetical protein [Streptomyces collinus]MEC7054933.1 hypothetical protein [Streptomyces violaceochromogenes]WMX65272.1 hypothetical protein RFN52_18630 [Streptomyces collinus]GHC75768.1 hypothetical protein GCM10010309_47340 [Streptomyces violaceochromogenes]
MRLLPWTGTDGKACYLSTDDPGSLLSRLADDVEAAQLASAETVLAGARAVLHDDKYRCQSRRRHPIRQDIHPAHLSMSCHTHQ